MPNQEARAHPPRVTRALPAKAAAQKNPALADAPGFSSIGQFHLTVGVE
jgi:hypothetical protein